MNHDSSLEMLDTHGGGSTCDASHADESLCLLAASDCDTLPSQESISVLQTCCEQHWLVCHLSERDVVLFVPGQCLICRPSNSEYYLFDTYSDDRTPCEQAVPNLDMHNCHSDVAHLHEAIGLCLRLTTNCLFQDQLYPRTSCSR